MDRKPRFLTLLFAAIAVPLGLVLLTPLLLAFALILYIKAIVMGMLAASDSLFGKKVKPPFRHADPQAGTPPALAAGSRLNN